MYNEHDRPSAKRMAITAGAVIGGIVVLIVAVSLVGRLIPGFQSTPSSSSISSVQAPATASTSPVAESLPAAGTTSNDQYNSANSRVATPNTTAGAKAAPSVTPVPSAAGLGTVVIDAGHEGSPPSGSEPIGPGSSVSKPKVESGTTGVATHVDESQRNLEVALKLQKVLEARGVKVVMVRTSQDVKISNKQRAQIANQNNAALFIRLHCDGGASSATGILTLEPGKNWYPDHPIVAKSAVAAKMVHDATVAATGARDRGITQRTDLSGFNWSQVPSVLVEMGQMSNPAEDRKLGDPAYQQKLADGMANGVVQYLKSR